MTKLSHSKILLLLVITPVLLFVELIVGFTVFTNIQSMNREEDKNSKLDTYLRTNTKYTSMAESAQRGYMLTGDAKFKETFELSREEIRKNKEYYDTLQNDVKSQDVSEIQALSNHKLSEMAQTIILYEAGEKDAALDLVKTGKGKRMMDSLRSATTAVRTNLSGQIAAMHKEENNLLIFSFLLISALIVFNIFQAYYTYRQFSAYTHRLEKMVASLEDANDRMSQYTDKSYHELKTPLRNIHGFAQLLKSRYSHVGEEDSEEDEFIQYITDGIRQMNRTIDNMREKYLKKSVNVITEMD